MTDLLARLRQRARATGARIVLAEGDDPRVLRAAALAQEAGVCRPILVGDPAGVRAAAARSGVELPPEVTILDPRQDPELPAMGERFAAALRERGLPVAEPRSLVTDRLYYADLLVQEGRADGAVMGAVATTAETLRAALRVVGVDRRYEVATSCFLMVLPDGRVLVYADCGVIPEPTAPQLADIAVQAAETCRLLVGEEPRVALLAFSTKGSARHQCLTRVLDAVALLGERRVDFPFDGELQADAALVPAVGRTKAPASPVAGRANVLIFPDLNSGNIAYKLTERLAGARAIGPLLRGLARPIHDLSRGCSVDDVLDTMAITALEATAREASR